MFTLFFHLFTCNYVECSFKYLKVDKFIHEQRKYQRFITDKTFENANTEFLGVNIFLVFFKSNHDEIDNTQQVGLACNKMINEKLTFYKWKQMSNKIYIIRYWCKIIKKYSPDQVLLNSEKKVKTDSLVLGSINDKSMSWLLFSKIYNSLFKNYQK